MLQAIVTFFLKPIALKFTGLLVALVLGLATSWGVLKWWENNRKWIKHTVYKYGWWALWLGMGTYFGASIFPLIAEDEAFLEQLWSVPSYVQDKYQALCEAHALPTALCGGSPLPGARKNKVYNV